MTTGAALETDGRRGARTGIVSVTRILPLIAALALGLTLAGCDKCGDFFWQKQPGACKGGPAPN